MNYYLYSEPKRRQRMNAITGERESVLGRTLIAKTFYVTDAVALLQRREGSVLKMRTARSQRILLHHSDCTGHFETDMSAALTAKQRVQ